MPKEKPLQGQGPIRGGDTLRIAETGYYGNIPLAAVNALECELTGLTHGTATLTIHIKDSSLIRYVTNRERSFVPGKPTTGSSHE